MDSESALAKVNLLATLTEVELRGMKRLAHGGGSSELYICPSKRINFLYLKSISSIERTSLLQSRPFFPTSLLSIHLQQSNRHG